MNKHPCRLKAILLWVLGVGMGFVAFQFDVRFEEDRPLFDIRTKNIAFGYHGVADHCAGGAANGTVDSGEGCDDNNSTNGDGCSSVCIVETGYSCSGAPSSCSPICGDGLIKGSEGCDDDGTTSGDGCSSSCAVETGYSCSGTPSSCSTTCGDGVPAGSEACDDSDNVSGDGCSSSCTVESGYTCSGTPSACISITCGNGVLQTGETCDGGGETLTCDSNCSSVSCGDGWKNATAGEECDDGNSSNTDACLTTCIDATCGDGFVRSGVEECDSSGTCASDCTFRTSGGGGGSSGGGGATYVPPPKPKRIGPPPPCGDAIVDPKKGEECDDGRFNGVTDCSTECKKLFCGDQIVSSHLQEECEVQVEEETVDGRTQYWFVSPACGLSCSLPTCEDGICEGGCMRDFLPACNGTQTQRRSGAPKYAAPSPQTVTQGVRRPPPPLHCGNGVHEPEKGEECDLGQFNGVSACSQWCEKLYCGDGEFSSHIGEECEPDRNDDGSFAVKTCGTVCSLPVCNNGKCNGGCAIQFLRPCIEQSELLLSQEEPQYVLFSEEPSAPTEEFSPLCGDRRIDGAEQCDDGNNVDGDGCSSLCVIEPSVVGRCGDGILEQWEECDNGEFNSDIAPNACRTDCRFSYCGDTILDADEECDDGNQNPDDGCNALCLRAFCGNGLIETGESCDNGFFNSNTEANACRMDCTAPRCGDGVTDMVLGERCDEGSQNSDQRPGACRTLCQPSFCGDSVVDQGEECDDGNSIDTDACQNSCLLPVCGDGIRQGNEGCDDGNTSSGDGCTAKCREEQQINIWVFSVGVMMVIGTGLIARHVFFRRILGSLGV